MAESNTTLSGINSLDTARDSMQNVLSLQRHGPSHAAETDPDAEVKQALFDLASDGWMWAGVPEWSAAAAIGQATAVFGPRTAMSCMNSPFFALFGRSVVG